MNPLQLRALKAGRTVPRCWRRWVDAGGAPQRCHSDSVDLFEGSPYCGEHLEELQGARRAQLEAQRAHALEVADRP